MGLRASLVAWQWQTYPRNHTRRLTLAVHAFAVPAFVVGQFGVLLALVTGSWLSALLSFTMSLSAFGTQVVTHQAEPEPPIPFDGPADAVSRIFVEQLVTFPRFVGTGEFARAWRAAG